MSEDDSTHDYVSRRSVIRGAGGVAAASMSGKTLQEARATGALQSVETDPHTRDVFRAIVDAVIPRTPELAEELGSEHEPGGLDTEIERFLIWDFNHFQELRVETLTDVSPEQFELDLPVIGEDGLEGLLAAGPLEGLAVSNRDSHDGIAGLLDGLDAVTAGPAGLDGIDLLDFGTLERIDVSIASTPDDAPVELDVVVDTATETLHRVTQNYPYSEALATAFEVIAIEYAARGNLEEAPMPANDKFPAGGLFVRLQPRDRLRCLDSIIDGSAVDDVHGVVGDLVPTLGVLKFAVMGVFGLGTLGYYSEWPGYGETKTDTPNERELSTPPGEVVGREQTGYPGPQPGYAAHRGFEIQSYRENDWRDAS